MSGRGAYYKAKYGGGNSRDRDNGGGGGGGGRGGGGGGGRGRGGAYYREKYGRKREGGDEGGGGGWGGKGREERGAGRELQLMGDGRDLSALLHRLHGKSYKAYNDMRGAWQLGEGQLLVDHIQSDPFAAPSRMRYRLPMAAAHFPEGLCFASRQRQVAAADFVARRFCALVSSGGIDSEQGGGGGGYHGPKGGALRMEAPSQHVLQRNAVLLTAAFVEARFTLSMPARGRSIQGDVAEALLLEGLPEVVNASLFFEALNEQALRRHVESYLDQEWLRARLLHDGLVAFVADGAVLPRLSGVSDKPMDARDAVAFASPPSLQRTYQLPHFGEIKGMGIPTGVTLIVGGGFHGKSTLLEALEVGCYSHIPGDGREFVVTDPGVVKVRAEDGRNIECVDISPFISNLPYGKATDQFRTPDASGSTSQAANIIEALEAGASTLLMDEDQAATNFMVRDKRMQLLVAKEKEPITPFISKVRSIYQQFSTSTVLVIGGVGDYFSVADTVVMMDSYRCKDVTEEAKAIAAAFPNESPVHEEFGRLAKRIPLARSFSDPLGSRDKAKVLTMQKIGFGGTDLDLSAVFHIVERGQTCSIAEILKQLARAGSLADGRRSLAEVLDGVEALLEDYEGGLEWFGLVNGNSSRPRRYELAAAINHLRTARFVQE